MEYTEEQGLCLDPHQMAAMCTYNTEIGDKMKVNGIANGKV